MSGRDAKGSMLVSDTPTKLSTYYLLIKKAVTQNNILNKKLNPSFVSGFTDAEGCFHVSVVNKADIKVPSNDFVVGGCRRKEKV